MAKKKDDSEVSNRTIFVCHVPDAESVCLAGTFNDWDPQRTLMERGEDGAWRAELQLDPGRYEYKFLINGHWCCEPGHGEDTELPHCVRNAFGTMNRVIDVDGEGGAVVEVGFQVARPSASSAL